MPELKGQRNAYVCSKCGGRIVTVNLVDGATPYIVECRANWPAECDGLSKSQFYRIDQETPPGWGWYMPDEAELLKLGEEWQAHCKAGGLKLRKLDGAERESFGGPRARHG